MSQSEAVRTDHPVDLGDVVFFDYDVATWLLFFLESHGADVVLTDTGAVQIHLDPMLPRMDAATAYRWCPVITALIPEMRSILQARRAS